ncbi:MarR family transcriptional regulator [Corynebacterium qintianiae]|uniref:MarR family transcriptional regulator n=1 Tax=Corynebacterium qintianiae TaxID=2709392 RepID=A0A7T0PEW1_9CORY|nr:MarR family transcriptional regulator [Corynebacterium qintianiae]QPK83205.1 MarR family transcriptional regulator [Corynebacterium qintianiae]
MAHNESAENPATTAPDPYAIAKRIRPAMTSLYVMYFRNAQQSDLTGPQLSIMTRLQEDGPCRINRLAEAEGVRMPTASNTVNQLEKRGLVRRIRDESDRRGVSVEMTPEGDAELSRVGEERTKYLSDMLGSLPEDDLFRLDELAEIVNILADNYVHDRSADSKE